MSVYTVVQLVQSLFRFYNFLILAYCLLSWFPRKPGGFVEDLGAVLATIVEPYINLFRRFIPPIGGMLDISPVVAIIVLSLIERVVLQLLVGILSV